MEFIFNSSSLKRLIYLLLVSVAAFASQHYFSNTQSMWMVWAGLTLSLVTTGSGLNERIVAVFLAGCTAAVFTCLAGSFSNSFVLLAFLLAFMTFFSMLLGQRYPEYFYCAFVVVMFGILSGVSAPAMTENIARAQFVLLGTFIAALAQIIFVPHFRRDAFRSLLANALHELDKLQVEVFVCLVQQGYKDNLYIFERRIHGCKREYLAAIIQLRRMKYQHELINRLETMCDIILSCAQIRRRVTDHTTFALCEKELDGISHALNDIFSTMIIAVNGKKTTPDMTALDDKIIRLEDSYHHVLQVSAREPLVFFLLIDNLKSLRDAMQNFSEAEVKCT